MALIGSGYGGHLLTFSHHITIHKQVFIYFCVFVVSRLENVVQISNQNFHFWITLLPILHPTKYFSFLTPDFLICDQVFKAGSVSFEVTQMSSQMTSNRMSSQVTTPAKRRRLESGWEFLREQISQPAQHAPIVPWWAIPVFVCFVSMNAQCCSYSLSKQGFTG